MSCDYFDVCRSVSIRAIEALFENSVPKVEDFQ